MFIVNQRSDQNHVDGVVSTESEVMNGSNVCVLVTDIVGSVYTTLFPT